MKNYYKGNFYKDHKTEYHKHRGWLVGSFMAGARKTDRVEIKFWKYKKGEVVSGHPKIQQTAIECIFVIKGKIEGKVGRDKLTLDTGDYAVLSPGVHNNISKVIKNVEGITIKAPSAQFDKVVLTRSEKRK